MISVSVPATSANLAVGFDVLGLALDLKAHFTFEMSTQKLEIIGDDPAFANSENLIYQAFSKFAEAIDQPVPNLRIVVDSAVPSARGWAVQQYVWLVVSPLLMRGIKPVGMIRRCCDLLLKWKAIQIMRHQRFTGSYVPRSWRKMNQSFGSIRSAQSCIL